jgi:hypothetical protein
MKSSKYYAKRYMMLTSILVSCNGINSNDVNNVIVDVDNNIKDTGKDKEIQQYILLNIIKNEIIEKNIEILNKIFDYSKTLTNSISDIINSYASSNIDVNANTNKNINNNIKEIDYNCLMKYYTNLIHHLNDIITIITILIRVSFFIFYLIYYL